MQLQSESNTKSVNKPEIVCYSEFQQTNKSPTQIQYAKSANTFHKVSTKRESKINKSLMHLEDNEISSVSNFQSLNQ